MTRRSSSRTFAWSPPNSSRNAACVPVVPWQPRKRSASSRCAISSTSSAKSCIQSVARLPTVVSCAGWKWVYARHGRSAVRRANPSSAREHGDQAAEQQAQAVAHHDEIGVVGDERAGGAEVQEGPGRGGLIAEGVDVGHHVVAEATLVAAGRREVGVVQVRPHLRQRLLGDREARARARPRRERATAGATARSGAPRPRGAASRARRSGCRAASASGRRSSEHQVGEGDLRRRARDTRGRPRPRAR